MCFKVIKPVGCLKQPNPPLQEHHIKIKEVFIFVHKQSKDNTLTKHVSSSMTIFLQSIIYVTHGPTFHMAVQIKPNVVINHSFITLAFPDMHHFFKHHMETY